MTGPVPQSATGFDWELIIKTAVRDRCDLAVSAETCRLIRGFPAAPAAWSFLPVMPNLGDPQVYVVDMPDTEVRLIDRVTLDVVKTVVAS